MRPLLYPPISCGERILLRAQPKKVYDLWEKTPYPHEGVIAPLFEGLATRSVVSHGLTII